MSSTHPMYFLCQLPVLSDVFFVGLVLLVCLLLAIIPPAFARGPQYRLRWLPLLLIAASSSLLVRRALTLTDSGECSTSLEYQVGAIESLDSLSNSLGIENSAVAIVCVLVGLQLYSNAGRSALKSATKATLERQRVIFSERSSNAVAFLLAISLTFPLLSSFLYPSAERFVSGILSSLASSEGFLYTVRVAILGAHRTVFRLEVGLTSMASSSLSFVLQAVSAFDPLLLRVDAPWLQFYLEFLLNMGIYAILVEKQLRTLCSRGLLKACESALSCSLASILLSLSLGVPEGSLTTLPIIYMLWSSDHVSAFGLLPWKMASESGGGAGGGGGRGEGEQPRYFARTPDSGMADLQTPFFYSILLTDTGIQPGKVNTHSPIQRAVVAPSAPSPKYDDEEDTRGSQLGVRWSRLGGCSLLSLIALSLWGVGLTAVPFEVWGPRRVLPAFSRPPFSPPPSSPPPPPFNSKAPAATTSSIWALPEAIEEWACSTKTHTPLNGLHTSEEKVGEDGGGETVQILGCTPDESLALFSASLFELIQVNHRRECLMLTLPSSPAGRVGAPSGAAGKSAGDNVLADVSNPTTTSSQSRGGDEAAQGEAASEIAGVSEEPPLVSDTPPSSSSSASGSEESPSGESLESVAPPFNTSNSSSFIKNDASDNEGAARLVQQRVHEEALSRRSVGTNLAASISLALQTLAPISLWVRGSDGDFLPSLDTLSVSHTSIGMETFSTAIARALTAFPASAVALTIALLTSSLRFVADFCTILGICEVPDRAAAFTLSAASSGLPEFFGAFNSTTKVDSGSGPADDALQGIEPFSSLQSIAPWSMLRMYLIVSAAYLLALPLVHRRTRKPHGPSSSSDAASHSLISGALKFLCRFTCCSSRSSSDSDKTDKQKQVSVPPSSPPSIPSLGFSSLIFPAILAGASLFLAGLLLIETLILNLSPPHLYKQHVEGPMTLLFLGSLLLCLLIIISPLPRVSAPSQAALAGYLSAVSHAVLSALLIAAAFSLPAENLIARHWLEPSLTSSRYRPAMLCPSFPPISYGPAPRSAASSSANAPGMQSAQSGSEDRTRGSGDGSTFSSAGADGHGAKAEGPTTTASSSSVLPLDLNYRPLYYLGAYWFLGLLLLSLSLRWYFWWLALERERQAAREEKEEGQSDAVHPSQQARRPLLQTAVFSASSATSNPRAGVSPESFTSRTIARRGRAGSASETLPRVTAAQYQRSGSDGFYDQSHPNEVSEEEEEMDRQLRDNNSDGWRDESPSHYPRSNLRDSAAAGEQHRQASHPYQRQQYQQRQQPPPPYVPTPYSPRPSPAGVATAGELYQQPTVPQPHRGGVVGGGGTSRQRSPGPGSSSGSSAASRFPSPAAPPSSGSHHGQQHTQHPHEGREESEDAEFGVADAFQSLWRYPSSPPPLPTRPTSYHASSAPAIISGQNTAAHPHPHHHAAGHAILEDGYDGDDVNMSRR